MIRVSLFILLVVLCGCFIGCGGAAPIGSEESTATSAEPSEDEIYIKLAEIDAQQSGETDLEKLHDRFKLFVVGIDEKVTDMGPLQIANALVSQQEFYYTEFKVAVRLYDMAYSMYNEAAMREEPTTWEDFGFTWYLKHFEIRVSQDGTAIHTFRK